MSGATAAGSELNATSSQRSAQTGSPVIPASSSNDAMNSTIEHASAPWRGSPQPGRQFSSAPNIPPGTWPKRSISSA
jgi:hypothetical protein